MKTTTRCRPLTHVSVLAGLALMLFACGMQPDDAAGATGALDTAPVGEAPVTEAAVIDSARVARADEALGARLAVIDDPEQRLAARFEQFRAAEADVMRDGELNTRSVLATSAAIRARLLGSEEAARDGEAADLARRDRGAATVSTRADLAAFELARTRMDERIGTRGPAPMELRTPVGIPTITRPPTAEELENAAH